MTRFTSGAQAFQSGQVGYDDVELIAIDDRPPADDDGGGGKPGGGHAVFDGRNLFLQLKCLGLHAKNRCHVRATALAAKQGGRRYTFPVQRKVRAKKGKVVRAASPLRFTDSFSEATTRMDGLTRDLQPTSSWWTAEGTIACPAARIRGLTFTGRTQGAG